jgi:dihydrofolate reductase
MILALDENDTLGNGLRLPWPRDYDDMRWFRQHTLDKKVVMGATTFYSLGYVSLPQRDNYVLSTKLDQDNYPYVTMLRNPEEVLDLAEGKEVVIMGGKTLYTYFFPLADRIYFTRIKSTHVGDVYYTLDITNLEEVYTVEKDTASFYIYNKV